MDEKQMNEYLTNKINSLSKKSHLYATIVHIANITKLVLSTFIPVLIAHAAKDTKLLLTVSLFSAAITIIQGATSIYGLDDKRQNISQLLYQLEKERLLFSTHTEPYNKSSEENCHLLVKNLEGKLDNIVSDSDGSN